MARRFEVGGNFLNGKQRAYGCFAYEAIKARKADIDLWQEQYDRFAQKVRNHVATAETVCL